MTLSKSFIRNSLSVLFAATLTLALAACESTTPKTESTVGKDAAKPAATATPATARPTIRINAGSEEAVTDAKGVKWAADTGAEDGSTENRPELPITGTTTPEIYRTERYSMSAYALKVPNGAYLLKLHFSEDYEGIGSAEERVFTYAVKDGTASGKTIKEVKDFSPWKAAGGQFKAYVDTVPVNVTAGQITITFTPQVENPQINAIEVIPQ